MDKGEENWVIRRQAFSEWRVKLLGFTWTYLSCYLLRCDPGVPVMFFIYFLSHILGPVKTFDKQSKTRMTASILKQDPNTLKVKNDADAYLI